MKDLFCFMVQATDSAIKLRVAAQKSIKWPLYRVATYIYILLDSDPGWSSGCSEKLKRSENNWCQKFLLFAFQDQSSKKFVAAGKKQMGGKKTVFQNFSFWNLIFLWCWKEVLMEKVLLTKLYWKSSTDEVRTKNPLLCYQKRIKIVTRELF